MQQPSRHLNLPTESCIMQQKEFQKLLLDTGDINVDFADVRTIMKDMGDAMIGTGMATGENRLRKLQMMRL